MPEMTNAPRDQRGALQRKNETSSKVTRPLDLSHCGPHCGSCWETFAGDLRFCEVEATSAARRDLREALAGGGDRA